MFRVYLSRAVSPGTNINLPAIVEEVGEAYSLLNGTDTVPLETATVYMESSAPNLRQYLYEVPVSEKRLEELGYPACHVKWMNGQDEAVFGTVIETMKPETLQNITNLSYNMGEFRYLPSTTIEAKLEEYLLKGYLDMTMRKQVVRPNYEWIRRDYIKKHDSMLHAFGYTSGIQEELGPIYGGSELPNPDFKQTCNFKVWIYKGSPYDSYTLTLLATEGKMDALRNAMGISNWNECKQLDIQCRVPTLWDWLPEYGSIEKLNDLVTEHCQSVENQQAPVLEM